MDSALIVTLGLKDVSNRKMSFSFPVSGQLGFFTIFRVDANLLSLSPSLFVDCLSRHSCLFLIFRSHRWYFQVGHVLGVWNSSSSCLRWKFRSFWIPQISCCYGRNLKLFHESSWWPLIGVAKTFTFRKTCNKTCKVVSMNFRFFTVFT